MSSPPTAAAEIVQACLESGDEAAWEAFVRCFQPLIASNISRVVRRYGQANPSLVDDLIQETYLRVCKDQCRSLRNFHAQHDQAIFGYIKVIAISVALDHFRTRATQKRRSEVEEDVTGSEASTSSSTIEQATLLKELEQRLAATETDRDCTIFWLYYRQGYTAKDISGMPHLGLSQKGVESCIFRLTQVLRTALSGSRFQLSGIRKGKSTESTLGGMQ